MARVSVTEGEPGKACFVGRNRVYGSLTYANAFDHAVYARFVNRPYNAVRLIPPDVILNEVKNLNGK